VKLGESSDFDFAQPPRCVNCNVGRIRSLSEVEVSKRKSINQSLVERNVDNCGF